MAITDVLNLTPQLVAEQNPELHEMRKIAFGEDYLSDIAQTEAGQPTGTAQYYKGWGNVPTIDWTQQDAETTVPVETDVAPITSDTGGAGIVNAGVTAPIGGNTPFEQNLIDQGVGVQLAPGQPVVAPGEIPVTQAEMDEFNRIPVSTDYGIPYDDYNYPGIGQEGRTMADVAGPVRNVTLPSGDVFAADDPMLAEKMDVAPEARNAWQKVQSGLASVGDFIADYGTAAYNMLRGSPVGTALSLTGEGIMGAIPEWSEADIAAKQYAQQSEQFDPSGALGKDAFGLNTRTTDGKTYVDRVQERQEELKDIIADQKERGTFKENSFQNRQFKHNENVLAEQGITPTVEEDILSDFPTGDAQVAADIFKQPEDVLEAKQEQQEYIQEIQQQETVQSGSREAEGQQRDTGVAKVETDHGTRYESSSGDTYASASEAAEKGDGGGGGSSKIVCTMMNDSYGFGSFRNKIWLRQSKNLAPEYQIGYHKIFLPLVKLSKKNIVLKKILEHIAIHRTIDIRQEARGKRHLLGRLYRKILEPICYWAGKNR